MVNDQFIELCDQLDELTLRKIDLIDEQLVLMKKLENLMASGFLNLAKSRYINGERSVSILQVPGNDGEICAASTVTRNGDDQLELEDSKDGTDSIKWFGLLVPSTLRQSQQSFKKSVQVIVEIVNTRRSWNRTVNEFQTKIQLKNSE